MSVEAESGNISQERDTGLFGGWCSWRRFLIRRTTTYKTTWKLRVTLFSLLLIPFLATRAWWVPAVGWGLVTDSGPCKPDLILIDNLEPDHLLFEKAEELRKTSGDETVLVPVTASGQDPGKPGLVPGEVAEAMIRIARLKSTELLPIRETEPISLNAARQIGEFIKSRPNIRSALVVTDGFRSRRTQLIYSRVLGELGVVAYTFPVWGTQRPENWTATRHGVQTVMLQYIKLLYYKALVFWTSTGVP